MVMISKDTFTKFVKYIVAGILGFLVFGQDFLGHMINKKYYLFNNLLLDYWTYRHGNLNLDLIGLPLLNHRKVWPNSKQQNTVIVWLMYWLAYRFWLRQQLAAVLQEILPLITLMQGLQNVQVQITFVKLSVHFVIGQVNLHKLLSNWKSYFKFFLNFVT